MDLPMAMRFRHLREHAKEAVGVYRYVHLVFMFNIFNNEALSKRL